MTAEKDSVPSTSEADKVVVASLLPGREAWTRICRAVGCDPDAAAVGRVVQLVEETRAVAYWANVGGWPRIAPGAATPASDVVDPTDTRPETPGEAQDALRPGGNPSGGYLFCEEGKIRYRSSTGVVTDPPPGFFGESSTRDTTIRDKCGPVSPEEAREALRRFCRSHFRTEGEKARAEIPANPLRDDDIRLGAFIDQAEKATTDLAFMRTSSGGTVELLRRAREERDALLRAEEERNKVAFDYNHLAECIVAAMARALLRKDGT